MPQIKEKIFVQKWVVLKVSTDLEFLYIKTTKKKISGDLKDLFYFFMFTNTYD